MALKLEEFEPTVTPERAPDPVPDFGGQGGFGDFGAAPAPAFGEAAADPFAAPADPFAAPDFATPSAATDPFAPGAAADPFATPSAADPFAATASPAEAFPAAGSSFPGVPEGSGKGDYDDGYKAGWEDAERKSQTDAERLSEALLQSVQDLSFTLHEARVHVLKLMRPLINSIMTSLVPQLAAAALPTIVADEIDKIASDLAEEPLVLRVCPEDETALQHAIDSLGSSLRVKLQREPSLVSGQVLISAANLERRIDLDEVRSRILTALRTLTNEQDQQDEMVA